MIANVCVNQGKLPKALHRVQDKEAQRFIRKCLAPKSERLSASDLLLDPFLSSVGDLLHTKSFIESEKPFLNYSSLEKLKLVDSLPRTNMTITGNLKTKDGTIILKVQFSDGNGMGKRGPLLTSSLSNTTCIDIDSLRMRSLYQKHISFMVSYRYN